MEREGERERAACFTFLPCDCLCYVALPRGAVGWFVVCDCDISSSYSLTFSNIHLVIYKCMLEESPFWQSRDRSVTLLLDFMTP